MIKANSNAILSGTSSAQAAAQEMKVVKKGLEKDTITHRTCPYFKVCVHMVSAACTIILNEYEMAPLTKISLSLSNLVASHGLRRASWLTGSTFREILFLWCTVCIPIIYDWTKPGSFLIIRYSMAYTLVFQRMCTISSSTFRSKSPAAASAHHIDT